jgi:hypothetical protein
MTTLAQIEQSAIAQRITDHWTAVIGIGFHPDTRGKDYSPRMSAIQIMEYDADMETLFALDCDPYAEAIASFERGGLI